MRTLPAAFACFALLARVAHATEGQTVTLVLPHALRAGESAWLELTVGAIETGAEVEVSTVAGRLLGIISPFGIRLGQQAGTYTVPLPAAVFANGRVSLRLSIERWSRTAPAHYDRSEERTREDNACSAIDI